MSLSVTNVSDNPQIPGVYAEAYIPDQLIAGNMKIVTDSVTIVANVSYVRGTVLGQVSVGALTFGSVTIQVGTGNFTVGSGSASAGAVTGTYTAACIAAGATGKFRVEDPNGVMIGEATVGTAFSAGNIGFTITDAGTHAVVGDWFTFPVTAAAGSGQYKKSVASATDGSQNPVAILVNAVDTTGGSAKVAGVYVAGEFNQNALTMDASWTAATLKPILRPLGIYLKDSVTAADPS